MTRIGHKPSAFGAALAYAIVIGWPLACVGSEASADSDLGSPPITVTRSTTYATVGFPFSAVISRSGAVLVSVTRVANATILDVTCPVSAKIAQTIPTGSFPREINLAPDDATLLLTNYLSETFQVIETSTRIWDDQNDVVPMAAGRGTSRENDSAGKPRYIGCQRPDHDSLGISGPSTGESDSN